MTGTFIPRTVMPRTVRLRWGDPDAQPLFLPPPGMGLSFRRALRALDLTEERLADLLDDDRRIEELDDRDLPTRAPDHLVERIRRMASADGS